MVAGPVNRSRDILESDSSRSAVALNPNAQGQLARARRPIGPFNRGTANSCHNATQSVGPPIICQSFDSIRRVHFCRHFS
jgi:hypothetical protein